MWEILFSIQWVNRVASPESVSFFPKFSYQAKCTILGILRIRCRECKRLQVADATVISEEMLELQVTAVLDSTLVKDDVVYVAFIFLCVFFICH